MNPHIIKHIYQGDPETMPVNIVAERLLAVVITLDMWILLICIENLSSVKYVAGLLQAGKL